MADNDVQEAAASAPQSKKMLMMIAGAAVVLGGAIAWFLLSSSGEGAAEGEQAVTSGSASSIQYLDLTPAFIVNFPYQGRQRFLQANLTVMTRDPDGLAAVTEHMPIIRNNLINLFSAQMLSVVESPQSGIEDLRQLATREVQEILMQETGKPGIEEVLFTAFVLQ